MRRFVFPILSFALLLLAASCQSRGAKLQSFRYHQNARQKPIAALIPLIKRVDNEKVGWDISQEVTAEVQRRIINRAQLFLNPVQIPAGLKSKLNTNDLITLTKEDLSIFREQNEYVVFMELLEHHEISGLESDPLTAKSDDDALGKTLAIKVRVRVFDIRTEEPKVLLQEILHSNHFIPKVERDIDYTKVVWGGDSYPASVYGRAHAKLEKDLARHIEKYISISK